MKRSRLAYTLVEIAIVLLMGGLVATALVPQIAGGLQRRRQQAAFFQQLLELHVERFRQDHQGLPPGDLLDLTRRTDISGNVADAGKFGPYLDELPLEPLSGSRNVTQGEAAASGWRYWPETGRVARSQAE